MPAIQYNADGLAVKMHGDYESNKANFVNRLKATYTDGFVKQAVFELDLTKITAGTTWFPVDRNNDGTNDGFSGEESFLPQGALVTRVVLVTTEAAAGGTSFTLGTYTQAGAATAATSLITATEGVTANMASVGAKINGNGALTSNTAGAAGLPSDGYVTAAVVGTFTTGKATIIIEYIPGT